MNKSAKIGNIIGFGLGGLIVLGFAAFGIGAISSREASIIAGEMGSAVGGIAGAIYGATRKQ